MQTSDVKLKIESSKQDEPGSWKPIKVRPKCFVKAKYASHKGVDQIILTQDASMGKKVKT